jgi:hypothetical protein
VQNRFIFIVFSALLALSGCVTTDQTSNGFTKIKEEDIRSLEKEKTEKSNNKSIQYFVVAQLRSVNDQPQEFLEFKSKRFRDKGDCETWMIANNRLLNESLNYHVTNRKRGYFVDNIKCLKTSMFFQVRASEAISV